MRWWGVLVLMTGLALAVPRADAQPRPLLPAGTPVKIVVVPVKQGGNRVPGRAQLDRSFRRAAAWYRRVSYGRLRLEYAIAPAIRQDDPAFRDQGLQAGALAAATRGGVDTAGAMPVVVEATRDTSARSYGSVGSVQLRGTAWNRQSSITHELGHALGLDHATAPTVCRRPFRPLACTLHPRRVYEYGDSLDNMGGGVDRFTGYALAAFGVVPVRDAPAGGGVTRFRSLEARDPTVLRLRTASHDWYVDTRRSEQDRVLRRRVRAPRGVGIARVSARYALQRGLLPKPIRVPASDPQRVCRAGTPACLARQIFQPGRQFTVPGAFRLRVLGGGGGVRVATRWLDRTPPRLAVAGARIERPYGAPAQLVLPLRAAASGAGVLRVDVDQGGAVTSVDPDAVPGLVAGARGRGTIRIPVGAAPVARVTAVDAAGNVSAPIDLPLAALPSAPSATITSDPPLTDRPERPAVLAAGQVVTFSGRTDPAFAGPYGDFEVIGTAEEPPPVLIQPDGTFAVSWTAPRAGEFQLRLRVPVARKPNGFDFVFRSYGGVLRG